MEKRRNILLSLLFSCVLCGPLGAHAEMGQGRPITARDLVGKKICYSDGIWEIYLPGGKSISSFGHRQWSVPRPGLIHHKYSYMEMEVLPDGRVHGFRKCASCSFGDVDVWGTQCN